MAALVASLPAQASAARVEMDGSQLLFRGGSGEVNEVFIDAVTPADNLNKADYEVEERKAPLAVGRGCTRISGGARCRAANAIAVDLGDRKDSASLLRVNDAASTRVAGGTGDDTIIGGGLIPEARPPFHLNTLSGGPGRDTLLAGDLANMNGDEGDDFLFGGSGGDIIQGGFGTDGGNDRLLGAAGNDDMDGGIGNDSLDGGPGDDRIEGGSVAFNRADHDAVSYSGRVNPVNVTVDGIANDGERGELDNVTGAERLTGGSADDTLAGSGTNDTLTGRAGNDRLLGRAGDDLLIGGTGQDAIEGEAGNDTTSYADHPAGVTVRLDTLNASGNATDERDPGNPGNRDSALVENVIGTNEDDVIVGDNADNVLSGGGADDEIHGGFGSDRLRGGAQDDVFVDGFGADVFEGGDGLDTASYVFLLAPARVVVDLDGRPDDAIDFDGDGDLAEEILHDAGGNDVEGISGGAGDDELTGNAQGNVLAGRLGSDVLRGLEGGDRIDASDGIADSVLCGPGTDNAILDLKDTFDSCETFDQAAVDQHPVVRVRPRRVRARDGDQVPVGLRCPGRVAAGCAGTVRAAAVDRTGESPRRLGLGEQEFRLGAGESDTVEFVLGRRARALLARVGRLRVRVFVLDRDPLGQPKRTLTTITARSGRARR